MPMKNPPHPGDFIRTEIIEPAGLTVTAAAAALQVSRPALSSLLNGKANLSGDMALRLEKAFGVKMERSCGCNPPTTSPRPGSVKNKSASGAFSAQPTFIHNNPANVATPKACMQRASGRPRLSRSSSVATDI